MDNKELIRYDMKCIGEDEYCYVVDTDYKNYFISTEEKEGNTIDTYVLKMVIYDSGEYLCGWNKYEVSSGNSPYEEQNIFTDVEQIFDNEEQAIKWLRTE